MKSAREWALASGADERDSGELYGYCEHHASDFVKIVEAIQLDAYKAGMNQGAFMVEESSCDCNEIADAIRTASDNLTKLPTPE